ncbi:palmitoyltransferase PFA5 [Xylariaceae sp. FL0804]|nr:palmitoyltransferase PFA5 [Xylariaceae sp. FL0804]
MPAIESTRAATRWITRIVPVLLAAAVGYSTYVVVARVCSSYLIDDRGKDGAAIAILVLYFVFLLLMVAAYFRTLHTTFFDPGLVPLGPLAVERRNDQTGRQTEKHRTGDLEGRGYNAGPDMNPDSPGLELFYTKNVFVCESDGRPRWCSHCCNWKPDRAHHSSEIGRCVIRMDHYCPWVGGMIGENSFKFFVQFTTYTACYCAIVLGASASTLRNQVHEGYRLDGRLIAAIALAAFFGLFTFLMSFTSMRYIFLNMTNVDALGYQRKVYQLATRVPLGTMPSDKYTVVTYPLPKSGPATASEQSTTHTLTSRDSLATRTFAILRTDPQENPWDLGWFRNWQLVMGTNPLDWLLPIRESPCANHDSHESYYPMGSAFEDVRKRHGLAGLPLDEGTGVEMSNIGNSTT